LQSSIGIEKKLLASCAFIVRASSEMMSGMVGGGQLQFKKGSSRSWQCGGYAGRRCLPFEQSVSPLSLVGVEAVTRPRPSGLAAPNKLDLASFQHSAVSTSLGESGLHWVDCLLTAPPSIPPPRPQERGSRNWPSVSHSTSCSCVWSTGIHRAEINRAEARPAAPHSVPRKTAKRSSVRSSLLDTFFFTL